MSDFSCFSQQERAEILERSLIWEASLELERPSPCAAPAASLSGTWVKPREVIGLVNRIRVAQGLHGLDRLPVGHTQTNEPTKCLFAVALQCMATYDELMFLTRARARRVAAVLGVPVVKRFGIETPDMVGEVMACFDMGVIGEYDLFIPRYEQLSFDQSAVSQAEDVLAVAIADVPLSV